MITFWLKCQLIFSFARMLILLDIDGVMVPAVSGRRPEILADGFPAFSAKATKALNKIISETGAAVVLTTSHKHIYTPEQWQQIFKLRGVINIGISSLPQYILNLNRRQEIQEWLSSKGEVENFVIIDDDKSLNAAAAELTTRLIQTSTSVGLTEEFADNAIAILLGLD